MTGSPPQLDYAPPPGAFRRRIRRAIQVLLLGAIVATGVLFGPAAWEMVRVEYWRRACLNHTYPRGTLISEEPAPWGGVMPPFTVAATDPKPWAEYERVARLPNTFGGPILFMHRRTTSHGVSRLVVVRRIPPPLRAGWDAPPKFRVEIHATTTFGRVQSPETYDIVGPLGSFIGQDANDSRRLRFLSGYPDPNDPSRFVIPFAIDGENGEIIGTFKDDVRADVRSTLREPYVELDGPP